MACGYLPFEDPNTANLYKKIISGEFRCPKFLSEDIKGLMADIMNTDPESRATIDVIKQHSWMKHVQSEE